MRKRIQFFKRVEVNAKRASAGIGGRPGEAFGLRQPAADQGRFNVGLAFWSSAAQMLLYQARRGFGTMSASS